MDLKSGQPFWPIKNGALGTYSPLNQDVDCEVAIVGAGITGLAVLAALIMLALDAPTFWTANVLFVGSFLGSLASGGVTLAAYKDGMPA